MELKILIFFEYILNKIILIIKIIMTLNNNSKILYLDEFKNYFCEPVKYFFVDGKIILYKKALSHKLYR